MVDILKADMKPSLDSDVEAFHDYSERRPNGKVLKKRPDATYSARINPTFLASYTGAMHQLLAMLCGIHTTDFFN